MGLTIFVGGWPELEPSLFEPDPDDAYAEILWRICQERGHDVHTCPACGDVSCLRCHVGLNP